MSDPVLPFILPGCVVDGVRSLPRKLVIEAHTVNQTACCPHCQQPSQRVHSRYQRAPHDLPVSDQAVQLRLHVRRFFCDAAACPQRTFAERLPDLLPVRAQRTTRLTRRLQDFGVALGGEAGARLATRSQMPLSGDTLLRIIRAIPLPTRAPARVIGLDDFALRKGRVYGTIFVDLEHHQVVDLVPERTAETVSTWLQEHAAPEVIARDRAQDYARGASDGAPEAIQVADRFHLLCNLREAVERALQRLTPALRQLLASVQDATVPPCETSAPTPPRQPRYGRAPSLERVQAARQAEREQRYQEVKAAAARGLSQRQIAAQVGLSTATIRTWLRTEALPADQRGYRARGKIDPYVGYLQGRLAEGCTNQTRLWQDIRKQGFTGTRSLVAKWIHAQAGPSRRSDTPAGLQLPSARQLAWLIVRPPTDQERDAEEQRLWTSLQQHTGFAELHGLAQTFGTLVRQREATALDGWLERARGSASPEFRNFAAGLERDYAAIHAALTLPWSTGPVEGHINRLKLIKRSAYGRADFDLLRQRVLLAA